MGAEQNIETIKAMYEAFGRGDVDAILELDAVRGFFEGIARTGPVTEFAPLAFAGNDDGDVMVFIRYGATATATGKDVAMNLHHYWKFREGKVCFVRCSEDTAQVVAALTP